jgi:predicted TIM-barrel fold metal-dependent hydrolase
MIIDVHHHWIPPDILGNIPKYLNPGERVVRDGEHATILRGDVELFSLNSRYGDIQLQLKEMDLAGVDVAVMSTACWQQWNTMEMAREINDALAELQEEYPHRVVGLAHIPPFGEEAVAELERAIGRLGLKGAMLTTNFDDKYPDDEAYGPFFKKAEELGIPICFHAAVHPTEYTVLKRYGLTRSLGRIFDHTLATFATLHKVAKEFPKLRFLHGHLGGCFFIMNERLLDVNWFRLEDQAYKEIINRQFFFDTGPGRWKSYHLECAVNSLGSDHILLGSDYPVDPRCLARSVETLKEMRVSEEDKRKILCENAAKLFRL